MAANWGIRAPSFLPPTVLVCAGKVQLCVRVGRDLVGTGDAGDVGYDLACRCIHHMTKCNTVSVDLVLTAGDEKILVRSKDNTSRDAFA